MSKQNISGLKARVIFSLHESITEYPPRNIQCLLFSARTVCVILNMLKCIQSFILQAIVGGNCIIIAFILHFSKQNCTCRYHCTRKVQMKVSVYDKE